MDTPATQIVQAGHISVCAVLPADTNDHRENTPAPSRRGRRVCVLLAGIFVLSMADLAVTLVNLHSTGMAEVNPVARFIIEHTQSWGLAAYKLATVSVCIGLLYRLRHCIQSEIASWIGIIILVMLLLYWGHYTTHMHHHDTITVRLSGQVDERWVTLAE